MEIMEPEHTSFEFVAPDVETAIVRAEADLGALADDSLELVN